MTQSRLQTPAVDKDASGFFATKVIWDFFSKYC
jgi:hypothetical protein